MQPNLNEALIVGLRFCSAQPIRTLNLWANWRTSLDRDIVDGHPAQLYSRVRIQMEAKLGGLPGVGIGTGSDVRPACAFLDSHGRTAYRIRHRCSVPLKKTGRGRATGPLHIDRVMVEICAFHLIALRPGNDHRRPEPSQVNNGRQQVLVAARIVSAGKVGLPAACSTVACRDGYCRRQAKGPFVRSAGMGEPGGPGLEVGGEHGLLGETRRTGGLWWRFADT
jgi:hypothetical protein